MLNAATNLVLAASLHGHAAAVPISIGDGPIRVSARINDRLIPMDLQGSVGGGDGLAIGQTLFAQHHEPGEGAVSVRMALGAGAPFGEEMLPQEGGVAAGPYWISQACILTNTDPLLHAVIGASFTLPVNDSSITVGNGAVQGLFMDLLNANGVYFAAPTGGAVASYRIDGILVMELLQDPMAAAAGSGFIAMLGGATWGTPSPVPIPAPSSTIEVEAAAYISPGDSAIIALYFLVN